MSRTASTLALIILLTALPGTAQDDRAKNVTLTTPGKVKLSATYWESPKGKESAVIVLLHGEGGNRKKWRAIAGGLQKADYAVLSVDLRKHGESAGASEDEKSKTGQSSKGINLKPTDFQAMCVDDMEAVKKFLMQKHHDAELNVRKTGLVAIGSIGGVALNAAAIDWQRKPYPDGPPSARTPRGQDIQTLVLISPDSAVKGLNLANALKALRQTPISSLVIVGNKDKDKKKSADKLVKQLRSGVKKDEAEDRVILHEFAVKLNGEMMVAKDNRQFLKLLIQFHELKLNSVDQQWRDRRSKLGR